MNLGTYKARLALNCGNLRSTDPWYPYLAQYASDALRLMPIRASEKFPNYQLFPEYKDIEWEDVTVADAQYLLLPSDSLAIQRVFSLDSATPPNLNNANWRLVTFIDPKNYDQQTKATTQIAYPGNWTQREGRLYLLPTPRASKTTYVKIDGIQEEVSLTDDSQVPRMHERRHPAWLDYGCFLLASDRDMVDMAQKYLGDCDAKIKEAVGAIVGLRKAQVRRTIRIAGMPQ